MRSIDKTEFIKFVSDVKAKIRKSQLEALRAVNRQLVELYLNIGEMIVEKQEAYGWGKSVVEKLSLELQKEFPGIRGYSVQNLWYMRQFFMEYQKSKNLQPLVGEISWTKNIIILSKCKDDLEREFYFRMTIKYGWTKNVLIHQIANKSYEKYLLNQTSFDQTLPAEVRLQAKLAVKDKYVFSFLELSDQHSEYELEQAILKKIRAFLIEMGGDFAFIANQYRLKVGDKEYFIDLLLFHRRLRCLIAIDLKIGEFEPEHKGKMEFYLSALNENMKIPEENDALGIIICKSKNKTIVEYALKSTVHPIGVATYTLTSKLPKSYSDLLPTTDAIKELLQVLM